MVKTKKNILKRKISNLNLNTNKSNYKSKFILNRRINSDNKKSKTKYNVKQISKLQKGGVVDKEIKHFWYREWPDHGAPDCGFDNAPNTNSTNIQKKTLKNFVEFVDNLYDDINNDHCGTVIHCSAGVGRTGTLFVILKICLERKTKLSDLIAKQKEDPPDTSYQRIEENDILNSVIYSRLRRMYLVQAIEQYKFLLDLFDIKTRGDYVNYWADLGKVKIEDYTTISKQPECKAKNRYGNILPFDYNIAYIDKNGPEDCTNYINASYLNKNLEFLPNRYSNLPVPALLLDTIDYFNGDIIATQGPKQNTKNDFLKMLDKHDIKRIIMLVNLKEMKNGSLDDKCFDYTSNNDAGTGSLTDITDITKLPSISDNSKKNQYNIYNLSLTGDDYNFKFSKEFDTSPIKIKKYEEITEELKLLAKTKNSEYIVVENDGWCFYYAILQGLSADPDFKPSQDDAIILAKQIADWLKANKDTEIPNGTNEKYSDWESNELNIYSETDNTVKHNQLLDLDQYINLSTKQKFDKKGPVIFAEADISGWVVAELEKIEIIILNETKLEALPAYIPFKPINDPAIKTINLVYRNGNHFDLLIPLKTEIEIKKLIHPICFNKKTEINAFHKIYNKRKDEKDIKMLFIYNENFNEYKEGVKKPGGGNGIYRVRRIDSNKAIPYDLNQENINKISNKNEKEKLQNILNNNPDRMETIGIPMGQFGKFDNVDNISNSLYVFDKNFSLIDDSTKTKPDPELLELAMQNIYSYVLKNGITDIYFSSGNCDKNTFKPLATEYKLGLSIFKDEKWTKKNLDNINKQFSNLISEIEKQGFKISLDNGEIDVPKPPEPPITPPEPPITPPETPVISYCYE